MSTLDERSYSEPPPLPPLHPMQEKQYAMLAHLLSAFLGFIPALIFFLLYKDRGPFVRAHTVTEWNFQLTALIAQAVPVAIALVGWATAFASIAASQGQRSVPPGIPVGFVLFFIGYVLLFVLGAVRIVFGIIATVSAHRGRWYRYRVAFPFVRA